MSAGSRIFIVVLVLAFLATGFYYLLIGDGQVSRTTPEPAVSEPGPAGDPSVTASSSRATEPLFTEPIASDTVAVRVTVPASDPAGVDLPVRRNTFQSDGPEGDRSSVAKWYPVYDPTMFASDPDRRGALEREPVKYFKDVYGLVVEPHEDVLYMLLYTVPSRSVAPSNYRGVEVLSVQEVQIEGINERSVIEIAFAESTAKRLTKIGEKNASRFWAVVVDDVVVEIQRINGSPMSSILVTSAFDEVQSKALEDAVRGTLGIEPARFEFADPAETTTLVASRTSTLPGDGTISTTVVVEEAAPAIEPAVPVEAPKPAATEPTKPVPAVGAGTRYTVKEGDTLSSISSAWFGDPNKWTLIAEGNPTINPNRLRVGQVIMLPAKTTRSGQRNVSVGSTYRVRSGDSLATIARSCYGSDIHWEVIYEANRSLIGSRPEDLKVGTQLKIPALPKSD